MIHNSAWRVSRPKQLVSLFRDQSIKCDRNREEEIVKPLHYLTFGYFAVGFTKGINNGAGSNSSSVKDDRGSI